MTRRFTALLCGAVWPFLHGVAHAENWQIVFETPAEIISVDVSNIRTDAGRVWFREKRVARTQQLDPNSLRRIREIQQRRIADCSKRLIATVSRAVFADDDALINYQARRPQQAEWTPALPDQAEFDRVCGRSPG